MGGRERERGVYLQAIMTFSLGINIISFIFSIPKLYIYICYIIVKIIQTYKLYRRGDENQTIPGEGKGY